MLNNALRTLSVVGLTPGALGELSGTPLAIPPVIRSAAPLSGRSSCRLKLLAQSLDFV